MLYRRPVYIIVDTNKFRPLLLKLTKDYHPSRQVTPKPCSRPGRSRARRRARRCRSRSPSCRARPSRCPARAPGRRWCRASRRLLSRYLVDKLCYKRFISLLKSVCYSLAKIGREVGFIWQHLCIKSTCILPVLSCDSFITRLL